jgi:hypothetical protein
MVETSLITQGPQNGFDLVGPDNERFGIHVALATDNVVTK